MLRPWNSEHSREVEHAVHVVLSDGLHSRHDNRAVEELRQVSRLVNLGRCEELHRGAKQPVSVDPSAAVYQARRSNFEGFDYLHNRREVRRWCLLLVSVFGRYIEVSNERHQSTRVRDQSTALRFVFRWLEVIAEQCHAIIQIFTRSNIDRYECPPGL